MYTANNILRRCLYNFKPFPLSSSYRKSSTLVLIEPVNNGTIAGASLNALSFAFEANGKKPIHAVIPSSDPSQKESICKDLQKYSNIEKIIVSNSTSFKNILAEDVAPLLLDLVKKNNYKQIIAASTAFGKNILPRAAGQSNGTYISDIIGIEGTNTFIRPIYAGEAK